MRLGSGGCGGVRTGGVVAAAVVLATATAGTAAAGDGVAVLPPSSHVTGTYPAHCHAPDAEHPDPGCTPGAVQSSVTPATIGRTICVAGWTATVRAPESETSRVKKAAMLAYGQPSTDSSTTELDHFVPLELGGSNDVSNLWPEPSDEPGQGYRNTKDRVENDLKRAVCDGRVPLAAAQDAIARDWQTAEARLGIG